MPCFGLNQGGPSCLFPGPLGLSHFSAITHLLQVEELRWNKATVTEFCRHNSSFVSMYIVRCRCVYVPVDPPPPPNTLTEMPPHSVIWSRACHRVHGSFVLAVPRQLYYFKPLLWYFLWLTVAVIFLPDTHWACSCWLGLGMCHLAV